jgi:hypothetical protein
MVRAEGREYSRPFDAEYLARSLASPETEVAVGFPRGVMPAYTLDREQLAAIEETLRTLEPEPPPTAIRRAILLVTLLSVASVLSGWRLWRWWRQRRATRAIRGAP